MPESNQNKKREKTVVGTVISDKMNKTIVVRLDTVTKHPAYSKAIRRSRNIKAHDEKSEAKTGDVVRVALSRPISKDKRWKLIEVVQAAVR
ncbi:MAG: 30S ribosomal protein S17 [Candidatus Omnitrophica bacterium]|nr:30S ribosomal protein S17 [Candidatus Omnitrophota bacterium]